MLRRLFSPCLFGHEERLRERDAKGRYWLACPRCDHRVAVLPGQKRGAKIATAKARKVNESRKVVSMGRGL